MKKKKINQHFHFLLKTAKFLSMVYVTEALNEGKKVLTDNKVLKSKVISGATGTSKDE
jgi:hypothetical protein